jgi:hypothetical protein
VLENQEQEQAAAAAVEDLVWMMRANSPFLGTFVSARHARAHECHSLPPSTPSSQIATEKNVQPCPLEFE